MFEKYNWEETDVNHLSIFIEAGELFQYFKQFTGSGKYLI